MSQHNTVGVVILARTKLTNLEPLSILLFFIWHLTHF